MGFPQVIDGPQSQETADTTSHTIALGHLVVGDLRFSGPGIILFSCDFDPGSVSISAGVSLGSIAGASSHLEVFYLADGVGGPNPAVVVTTGNAQKSASQSFEFTGTNKLVQPQLDFATGTDTAADPPSLVPTWGTQPILWIIAAASDANVIFSADPANYTDPIENDSGGTTTGTKVRTLRRELVALSEDPAAFTNTSRQWNTVTIAVAPQFGGFGRRPFRGGP